MTIISSKHSTKQLTYIKQLSNKPTNQQQITYKARFKCVVCVECTLWSDKNATCMIIITTKHSTEQQIHANQLSNKSTNQQEITHKTPK